MQDVINILDRYAIPDLMGKNFFIPDYQRGYRWDKQQIFQLLSDIHDFRIKKNSGSFYCLQPVIVKKCSPQVVAENHLSSSFDNNTWYEVIDGQQRLTTIKLIITFNNLYNINQKKDNCYKLFYQTRPELGSLFDKFRYDSDKKIILCSEDTSNLDIDSYHVFSALKLILEWFTSPGEKFEVRESLSNFPNYFSDFFGSKQADEDEDSDIDASRQKSVQVLWYELKDGTNPKDIFKRLNDSKIELSNSELIRALFLSESSDYKIDKSISFGDKELQRKINRQQKQAHITEQWDVIEHQLRNDSFWAFVTNNAETAYSNRIEYLFDLISQKNLPEKNIFGLNKKDDRYTYLYFDRKLAKTKKEEPTKSYLWELWRTIETYYSTLMFWYENRDLYHWIGYLVHIKGDNILITLLKDASEKEKGEFKKEIIELILGTDSIKGTVNLNYDSLRYPEDNSNIQNILCLYNIETYRRNKQLQFFPFRQYKDGHWTIEHIHAQNSEGLPKDDNLALMKWLEENIKGLQKFKVRFEAGSDDAIRTQNIIQDLEQSYSKGQKGITHTEVSAHFNTVLNFFNSFCKKHDLPSKIHEFSNLTLLSGETNTMVGKSAFEIKRQKIIKMDAEGRFIPYCTKKVFMKYCNIENNDFEVQQTSCWDDSDKFNYQKDIINVMEYLKKERDHE